VIWPITWVAKILLQLESSNWNFPNAEILK